MAESTEAAERIAAALFTGREPIGQSIALDTVPARRATGRAIGLAAQATVPATVQDIARAAVLT